MLGSPIDHSKSPDIHKAAYAFLNAPIQYDRIELAESDAGAFMTTLDQRYGSTKHLAGFSVTMPLKAALVPHMKSVSARVKHLGVLNTIVFDDNGEPYGYNTDVDGIRHALASADDAAGTNASMGILGAGGTASAAIGAAADMGVESIILYVRNPERAHDNLLVAEQFGLKAQVRLLDQFPQHVQEHSAIVSTLPAMAADWLVDRLPTEQLPPLLDVIYQPWPTALAAAWDAAGAQTASGLEMLLYQGVEQVKLFTEKLVLNHGETAWGTVTERMAAALGLPHE